MVNKFLQLIQQAFFPENCILCGMSCPPPAGKHLAALDICQPCQRTLPWLQHSCTTCALPLPALSRSLQCGQCLLSPPPFKLTIAPWLYQAPVSQLISRFKYSRQINYGRVLTTLMAPVLQNYYYSSHFPDFIIPTPLHWLRRCQRGFNQSELLANYLSASLSIPVMRCLKRQRTTAPQQSLNAQQRKHNLQNAFTLIPDKATNIQGKTVALLDDVVTTGATVLTISQILQQAGAKEIHVWCLARTDK